MLETAEEIDLDEFISVLRKDYSKLAIRIRELTHSVQCDCDGVTLRLHFPAINQGKATIWELINAILDYVTSICTAQNSNRRARQSLSRSYSR